MRSDFINLIGKKYGRLTILRYAEKRGKCHYWHTLCECGKEKIIDGSGMRHGLIQSCGCLHREIVSKPHKIVDGTELKHCTYCNEWLALSAFCKATERIDGLSATCSKCKNEILRSYREKYPDKAGEWARKNPERANANSQRYRREHPEWWQAWNAQYNGTQASLLRHRMSAEMRYCLKKGKNGKTWESLVGYTLDDLHRRLTKTMPEGYTWTDFNKLHIDHIIPITAFNIEDENSLDFHRCWNLKNLRLLPAKENLMKHNNLDAPFQPSLAIGVK